MVSRVISTVCNVLSTAILLVVIVVAGGIMGLRLFGYEPMSVLSGSMEPTYHVGGLVFINTKVEAEDMKVGDVITYRLENESVVTHRVVRKDENGRVFVTKGDNNQIEDPGAVSYDMFVGSPSWYIPKMGVILQNLTTKQGFAVECIGVGVLIFLFIVPMLLKPEKKPETAAETATDDTTEQETAEQETTGHETAEQVPTANEPKK